MPTGCQDSKPLNMAAQALDHPRDQLAIIDLTGTGRVDVTYGDLTRTCDALARRLSQDVAPGDRVGVLLGQSPWCAAAHLAIWKIGAISVPLFKLFKQDALRNRIGDSGLSLVLTDTEGVRMLKAMDTNLPGLRSVASSGEPVRAKMPLCHRKAFGLNINKLYGQAKVNMMGAPCGVDFAARPGYIGDKAYVMLKDRAARGANALKQYIQERLATRSYIIEISFMDALPLTVTAK